MTSEERISALENQVAQMHASYQQAMDLMQFLGGSERVFQAAFLALIRKHPNKAEFRELLLDHVERSFVSVHFDAQNESHQQGAEGARNLIRLALDAD
ncbi:MAG: hypothetical protein WDZ63_17685 [Burkholderiales bacterium]